ADEVSHERRQAIVLAAEPMVLNDSVLAFNEAGFAEAFRKRCRMASGAIERSTADKADHRHRRLLRACRERPRGCCTAEQRDELPPSHSISSSASNWIELGTSMPSALAVCMLITNSNFVDCRTGRSAGFAPLRT